MSFGNVGLSYKRPEEKMVNDYLTKYLPKQICKQSGHSINFSVQIIPPLFMDDVILPGPTKDILLSFPINWLYNLSRQKSDKLC